MQPIVEEKITELAKIETELTSLKQKADRSKYLAKQGFKSQIETAEDHLRVCKIELAKASKQTVAAVDEIKKGLDKAWTNLAT